MKHNTMLTVASLLSLLFLTLHITDDIVRGISKAESSNTALLVLAVFLYGTLVLPERRSGHVIILLIGLMAAAMPVMHMRGAHYGGDVCAILATGVDTQSCGCDPGPECSGRVWPSGATNAPGIRGGIGKTALLLGGLPEFNCTRPWATHLYGYDGPRPDSACTTKTFPRGRSLKVYRASRWSGTPG